MIWKRKKKLGKKWISLLRLNEFNLNDGFENYIVAKSFDAPSNDKKVWKKKKIHNSKCYINSFCYTIPKLTKIKNKNIYKKLSHYWNQYIYIYIYKQRPYAGVHEVLPSVTLILHYAFFFFFYLFH